MGLLSLTGLSALIYRRFTTPRIRVVISPMDIVVLILLLVLVVMGGIFPPLVLGFIRAETGSYLLGFVFLSCFAALCLLLTWSTFMRYRKRMRDGMIERF